MRGCYASFGQYASDIQLYSCEYGDTIQGPQVYTTSNLVGKPSCYPDYGDHPRVCSLRSYGTWWQSCPSAPPPLPQRRPGRPPTMSFIDVKFNTAVHPKCVDIFETYQCGTVVGLWGRDNSTGYWWRLWSGPPNSHCKPAARRFSPPIRSIDALVSTIRLELDYSQHMYHPCLDAVLLTGSLTPPRECPELNGLLPDYRHQSQQYWRKTDDNDNISSGSAETEHDESFSEEEDEESSEEQDEVLNKHSDNDPEGSHSPGTDADEDTCNIHANCDSRDEMRAYSQGAGEEAASTLGSRLPRIAVPGTTRAALEEELACLNICNKVVMHGLQNVVRTRDDIMTQGPQQLGSHRISQLLESFVSTDQPASRQAATDSAPAVGCSLTNQNAKQREPAGASGLTSAVNCVQEATVNTICEVTAIIGLNNISERVEKLENSTEGPTVSLRTSLDCLDAVEPEQRAASGLFHRLPPEIILRVLALLDLRSLCRLAQTCSQLHDLAYLPQHYAYLSLRDWWWVIDNSALLSLLSRLDPIPTPEGEDGSYSDEEACAGAKRFPLSSSSSSSDWGPPMPASRADPAPLAAVARLFTSDRRDVTDSGTNSSADVSPSHLEEVDQLSSHSQTLSDGGAEGTAASDVEAIPAALPRPIGTVLTALDLSWCGQYGAITPSSFLELIHRAGQSLKILRLSCCDFVDNYCLYMVANVCTELTELDVSRCSGLDLLGLGEIKKMSGLTRLNVSNTRLGTGTLQVLLQHTPNLEHLSIVGCGTVELDEACLALARFCPRLVSLVAWKGRGLTPRGLRALAGLPVLMDLDVGWALTGGPGLSGSLVSLVQQCRGLVRLKLTAARYLSDGDITAVGRYCPALEQLDVMGNANLSPEPVHSVLQQCHRLRLLDVSYCTKITPDVVCYWTRRYPHVQIKAGAEMQYMDFHINMVLMGREL